MKPLKAIRCTLTIFIILITVFVHAQVFTAPNLLAHLADSKSAFAKYLKPYGYSHTETVRYKYGGHQYVFFKGGRMQGEEVQYNITSLNNSIFAHLPMTVFFNCMEGFEQLGFKLIGSRLYDEEYYSPQYPTVKLEVNYGDSTGKPYTIALTRGKILNTKAEVDSKGITAKNMLTMVQSADSIFAKKYQLYNMFFYVASKSSSNPKGKTLYYTCDNPTMAVNTHVIVVRQNRGRVVSYETFSSKVYNALLAELKAEGFNITKAYPIGADEEFLSAQYKDVTVTLNTASYPYGVTQYSINLSAGDTRY